MSREFWETVIIMESKGSKVSQELKEQAIYLSLSLTSVLEFHTQQTLSTSLTSTFLIKF